MTAAVCSAVFFSGRGGRCGRQHSRNAQRHRDLAKWTGQPVVTRPAGQGGVLDEGPHHLLTKKGLPPVRSSTKFTSGASERSAPSNSPSSPPPVLPRGREAAAGNRSGSSRRGELRRKFVTTSVRDRIRLDESFEEGLPAGSNQWRSSKIRTSISRSLRRA